MKAKLMVFVTCVFFISCEMVNESQPSQEQVIDNEEKKDNEENSSLDPYNENFTFYSYSLPFSDSVLGLGYSKNQNKFMQRVSEDFSVKLAPYGAQSCSFSSREISQINDFFGCVDVLSEHDYNVILGQEASSFLNDLQFDENHSIYINGFYSVGNSWKVNDFSLTIEAEELLNDEESFKSLYGDSICFRVISGFICITFNYYSFSKDFKPEDLSEIKSQIQLYEQGMFLGQEREEVKKDFMIPGVTKETVVICTLANLPEISINSLDEYWMMIEKEIPNNVVQESSYSLLGYDFLKLIH